MLMERDDQLATLGKLARDAQCGRGCIALLGGEAGIGKTSLLRAFVAQLGSGYSVAWGGCEALSTPLPFGPLHEVADHLDPRIGAALASGNAGSAIFPIVLGSLQNAGRSTVLVFEDVHWADRATLDLIKYLGRRVAVLPVLIVLSYRTNEAEAGNALQQVIGDMPAAAITRIPVQPLSEAAVQALAHAAGRRDDDLHRITRGNAFFVSELLAHGVDQSASVPVSVQDAVWARVGRVGAPERAVLETFSVMSGSIEPELILRLCGETCLASLDSCVAMGLLVRESAGTIAFRHEIARRAVFERLSANQQRNLHASAGAVFADMPASFDNIVRRAHHAAGAAKATEVLDLAPQAAAQSAQLGAHQEAAAHLASALRFVDAAPPELAAQLHEDWAYEAGIADGIDDEVIAARHKAVDLWRALGRVDKVGLNLRWLSRLHWYRAEPALAEAFIDDAVRELETIEPTAELAMAYSVRSQLHMLNDRMEQAVRWGQRAVEMEERFGAPEIRVHALNNIGTALLFSNKPGGRALLEESLALALQHGFHEHAARVYTNLAEWAVVFKDFALAEQMLAEGLSFDARHDLDAWTYYLVGRQAQLLMEQGRLREAETVASGVTDMEHQTLVMRLPALTVLGKCRMRLGERDGLPLLHMALAQALETGEPQRVVPVRLALAEAGWLGGDTAACHAQLSALHAMTVSDFDVWEKGELAVWWRRSEMPEKCGIDRTELPLARAAELSGDEETAAAEWSRLGLPYEAALSLIHVRGPGAGAALAQSTALLAKIDAAAAVKYARGVARGLGLEVRLHRRPRGPYARARAHPLGLTAREQEMLGLIVRGTTNREIATRMSRSVRTVEHHVSALLGKMNVTNRMEAVLRVHGEPWLLAPEAATKK